MNYKWDIFISHASEDKASVVIPLARLLAGAGLQVWLDEHELRIGDSLRAKIDDGLARSRFGIVLISPRFLEKRWTANELDALFAIEGATYNRLLPIWHEITAAEVARSSPLLCARVAAKTSDGLDAIARSIAQVVTSTDDTPSVTNPSRCRRMLHVLDKGSSKAIINFLNIYPEIVCKAVGFVYKDPVFWHIEGGGHTTDCAIGHFQPSLGGFDWAFLRFLNPQKPPISLTGDRESEVLQAVQEITKFRSWIASNPQVASNLLIHGHWIQNPSTRRALIYELQYRLYNLIFKSKDFSDYDFETQTPLIHSLIRRFESHSLAVVVVGRREKLTPIQSTALAEWNAELIGVRIRTYDWLVDTCIQATHSGEMPMND